MLLVVRTASVMMMSYDCLVRRITTDGSCCHVRPLHCPPFVMNTLVGKNFLICLPPRM